MSNEEERQGMRGHEDGNVRPADDRYGLHKPEDESEFIRTEIAEEALSNDGKQEVKRSSSRNKR